MKIAVVIPTYNERETIAALLDEVAVLRDPMIDDVVVIVVDHGSPDGTAEIVQAARRNHANLRLLKGERQGLGDALVKGFVYALEQVGPDAVIQMDADFSHAPADIPRLIAALDASDFVIGSRYVTGGRVAKRWHGVRRLISLVGNTITRWALGLRAIKDCTSGFRGIRTSLLRQIDLHTIRPRGYVFQIAMVRAAMEHNATITEVPITFNERRAGTSKFGFGELWRAMMYLVTGN
ncbi:MAG: glycosyltransferase [Candidatus Omnitrophica bacterium]|nr:glycosyltransferase [Candidatus Omnitrophota bacterium]